MANQDSQKDLQHLPPCAAGFINRVISKMRYRRRVCRDVRAELAAHFEDELRGCKSDEEKQQKALQVIAGFGDVKMLAVLLRRAKKRCRPLWRTAVVRTLRTVGALVLAFLLYSIWFFTGKPTIRVDYVELLNQKARPQVSDLDNAWIHFEKAATLYIKPGGEQKEQIPLYKNTKLPEATDFAGLSQAEQYAIAEHVRINEDAWSEFVAASLKPYCYREYGFGPHIREQDKWVFNIILPELNQFRGLAHIGQWRCRIDIAQGETTHALDNCLAIARNGRHLQNRATLVEQLTGLSLSRLAHEEIIRVLDSQELTVEQLAGLQRQLVEIYAGEYPLMNIEYEKLAFHDLVQHFFTDGGIGGGHLIPGAWDEFSNEPIDRLEGQDRMLFMPLFGAQSMLHARRDKTIAVGDRIYDEQIKLAKMTPYQRHRKDVPSADDILTSLSSRKFFLLHFIVPAFDRTFEFAFRGKVSHQATLTILALVRWRAEKGEYPASLDQLTAAGLLKDLPMDPWSDKPLIYRRTGDNFILYSLGPNFQDDGGEPGKGHKGRLENWLDNGDTVFWPLLEIQSQ
jgi:hypothetical protein